MTTTQQTHEPLFPPGWFFCSRQVIEAGDHPDNARFAQLLAVSKPRGAHSLVEVEIGRRFEPGEAGNIDRFLTSR